MCVCVCVCWFLWAHLLQVILIFNLVVAHVLATFLEEVERSRQRKAKASKLKSKQRWLLAALDVDADNMLLLQQLRAVDAQIMEAAMAARDDVSDRRKAWQLG
eukprot:COSAG01_NODE_18127_length_1099_cov_0.878000_2_plen_103_part_00